MAAARHARGDGGLLRASRRGFSPPPCPLTLHPCGRLSQAFTIEADDNAQILQLRWVSLQMRELLVLATSGSVMIYSADGQRLLHVVTAANEHGLPASFRGIGACVAGQCEYICVGVSTGAVCLVPIPDPEPNSVTFGDSLLSPT